MLWAISDLHVRASANRAFLERLTPRPDDWLIVAGDVGETHEHLELAWRALASRFRRVVWTPGNHELWTLPEGSAAGDRRYREMIELCRRHGVLTPEDPYPLYDGQGGPARIAATFVLYDYSFRPEHVREEQAVPWAMESGVLCADERLLSPAPYATRTEWCHARIAATEPRLAEASADGTPLVIVNHFPLRYDLARLPLIPRFSIWCGTRRTEEWHRRYHAKVVVSGHLHIRSTEWRDGVRFEEVSLGNPGQWSEARDADSYLRPILS